jgi:hypothetical protein
MMNEPITVTASGTRIAVSAAISAVIAVAILVLFVLPAEYAIDPTGVGSKLGLTQMTVPPEPTRTLEVIDPLAGNENIKEVDIPDFGEPVPLPNPAIHQLEDTPPRSETREITLDAEGETEIKTVLRQNKVLVYSWRTDRGAIYSDFHGHDPEAGDEFWVRYLEDQEGASGHSGSLIAPFDGEHGWYWLNYNDFPVTITLTITGYYDDVIDYSNLF